MTSNLKHPGWEEHDSSHIVRSRYNSMDRALDVEFQNGSIYRYHGVPPGEHQAFTSAHSQGEYHSRFIKDYYHCEQVK